MDIREYIFRNRLKMSDVAADLGITVGWLSKIAHGKGIPHKALKLLIEEYTKGAVNHEMDWSNT